MGRFLLGFAIGTALGAAAAILLAPRSAAMLRQGLGELTEAMIEVGREAAAAHERELWSAFRARLAAKEPDES